MSQSRSFEFMDDRAYMIPVTLTDPERLLRKPIERYESNTRYCMTYLTDRDALARLLPPGFSPTERPTVQVNYTICRNIDYMAGRDYSLVGVDALARFDGEVDHLEGYYGLVLWMDKYLPMVMGREIMGAAKILSEVPPMRSFEGRKCFSMSEEGSLLIDGEFWDLKELARAEIAARLAAGGDRQWLGWKYIPNVTSDGADISCATYLPVKRDVKRMWSAHGKLAFHETPWEHAPLSGPIVNKLIRMPILEYLDAWVQEDSCDYLFREDRVLR